MKFEVTVILCRVDYGSEKTGNFKDYPGNFEENITTLQKLRHGDALVQTEALLNYFEQEDVSRPA